jgi:hypothetical protein
MPGRHDHTGGNHAVAVMATAFVVLAGLMTCGFISLAIGGDVGETAKSTGILIGIVLLLMWCLRDRSNAGRKASAWGWLARKRRPRVAYHLESRSRVPPPPAGNAPPTAETVRDLTGGINTWVPSKTDKKDRESLSGRQRTPGRRP